MEILLVLCGKPLTNRVKELTNTLLHEREWFVTLITRYFRTLTNIHQKGLFTNTPGVIVE